MNLTELQKELRTIEKKLIFLHNEIENMKEKPKEKINEHYDKITKLARRYPLEIEMLIGQNEALKKDYLSGLSYLLNCLEEYEDEKLLYLCRIANSMKLPLTCGEIIGLGIDVDETKIESVYDNLRVVKYDFLTDVMMILNLGKSINNACFDLISDLIQIFSCDKDDVMVISEVAKSCLENNFERLKMLNVKDGTTWSGQFNNHISKSWIDNQRIYCGMYYIINDEFSDRKNRLKLNSKANTCQFRIKNQYLIDSYCAEPKSRNTILGTALLNTVKEFDRKYEIKISAKINGLVICIEHNHLNYQIETSDDEIYVYQCSVFDDFDKAKSWAKEETYHKNKNRNNHISKDNIKVV